jgi:DNA polymerase III psi subunit
LNAKKEQRDAKNPFGNSSTSEDEKKALQQEAKEKCHHPPLYNAQIDSQRRKGLWEQRPQGEEEHPWLHCISAFSCS